MKRPIALTEDSVAADASIVLEGNFARGSEFEAGLAALRARFLQIHCSAPLETLLERYRSRKRHPGHVDSERIAAVKEAVESGRHDPLDLPGHTIRVVTTDPTDRASLGDRVAGLAEGRYELPSRDCDDDAAPEAE